MPNIETPELKPCPFCGGEAHFDHDDSNWQWIECDQCHASTHCSVSAMEDCKPILAESWNRRIVTDPARDAAIRAESAELLRVREECAEIINPMIDKALNSMPAQQDGGGFIVEHFDQDGNYQGSENIPEMDVIQLLHGALLDIRAAIVGKEGEMSDRFKDGTTDWHNWMRDTMHIDPSDSKTIALVWAVIGRCKTEPKPSSIEPAPDLSSLLAECKDTLLQVQKWFAGSNYRHIPVVDKTLADIEKAEAGR